MPTNIITELSKKILNDTEQQVYDKNRIAAGIDPLTIIIVIGVVVNIIRVIQECNKEKTSTLTSQDKAKLLSTDVRFRSLNHSFLTRWRVRSIIKKNLNKDQYKFYGEALLKSLLKVGKEIKDEEMKNLLEYDNV